MTHDQKVGDVEVALEHPADPLATHRARAAVTRSALHVAAKAPEQVREWAHRTRSWTVGGASTGPRNDPG